MSKEHKEQLKEIIKKHILMKLTAHRVWQHKHTNINNLPKGLPPHMRDLKIVNEVVSELIRKDWMLSKPTSYGLELSLNIRYKKEIEDYLNAELGLR